MVLVAFRLSFFVFSEEFYFLTRLFQRFVFVSLISLSISLRVCACKAETNIMSIIALCLPREGKNARKCVVPFVFVCVRALLSRSSRVLEVVRSSFFDLVVLSSHMRETFEHPERDENTDVSYSPLLLYPHETSCKRTNHHPSPRAVYARCLRPRNTK